MTALPTNLLSLLLFLAAWFLFNHLIDERNRAVFEVSGLREAARISGEMLADRDEIDRTRTEELNHALSENAELRRAVDDGTKRLRVKAVCPTSVPTNTSPGSVADAATPELTADARSDYFILRDQLALSEKMILGLQDHARRICLR